jgi:CubicO group peptidase (beta-lactamase class C family)
MKNSGNFDFNAIQRLKDEIQRDIDRGRGDGAVILLARHGDIELHEAFGHANKSIGTSMRIDSVFNILSITKAMVNTLIFQAVEHGRILLTTPVVKIIPEFGGGERDRIQVVHLLSHTSGLPTIISPAPDSVVGDLTAVISNICKTVFPVAVPGEVVSYSPSVAHALLGEMLRRLDEKKRTFRQILQQELLDPLSMRDTSLGRREDLRERHVPLYFADPKLPNPFTPPFWSADAEMPWVGAVSTSGDLFRLTELFRRGGQLDQQRLLSPAILDLATRNHTGDKPNNLYKMLTHPRGWGDFPAYIGLGFFVRGEQICPNRFGTLTSPRTYGHTGLGSTLFWIDPQRDLTFICLTAGAIEEGDNFERFQKLSDMAVAATL